MALFTRMRHAYAQRRARRLAQTLARLPVLLEPDREEEEESTDSQDPSAIEFEHDQAEGAALRAQHAWQRLWPRSQREPPAMKNAHVYEPATAFLSHR